jgi:glycosyltransferase involved in cell wall biosynthesis
MRSVFFYLPNLNSISTSKEDFLQRLNGYGKSVFFNSNGEVRSITLLTNTKVSSHFDYLQIIHLPRNAFSRFRKIHKHIGDTRPNVTLVAGNNFNALLFCLIQRFFSSRVRVQASVHGKLDLILHEVGVKGFVKRFVIKRLLPYVDSLRLVDENEIDIATTEFRLSKTKIFVAPVPVRLPDNIAAFSQVRKRSIGFVGRFHEERGVEEWLKIAEHLSKIDSEVEFHVIGDGPLRNLLETTLVGFTHKAHFWGFLHQDELDRAWPEIGVLLVCAPSESYGMAIRESLVHAVPVVARENSSSLSIKKVVPELVSTYINPEEAAENILAALNKSYKQEWFEEYLDDLRTSQERSLDLLARSWLK